MAFLFEGLREGLAVPLARTSLLAIATPEKGLGKIFREQRASY